MTQLEMTDIQGIVLTGYPKNPYASYLLLEVTDRRRAGAWLSQLSGTLATGEHHSGPTVNVAFTARGLSALGMPAGALATFAAEFCEGMSGAVHRSRILGDTGDSDPASWLWGAKSAPVDALVMLFAPDAESLAEMLATQRRAYAGALREVFVRDSVTLPARREHFGFADGIAQPAIAGTRHATAAAPGIEAGEFLFGYPNAYGQMPVSPTVPVDLDPNQHLPGASRPAARQARDIGKNGTYLVVRQLEQRVEEFWDAMAEYSRKGTGAIDRDGAVRIAAKCVGRWPSGAPLVKSPDRDDPAFSKSNDFTYSGDASGLACPVGSHIRRTNPRDSLEGGAAKSLAAVARHRIVRRGRSYGPPLERFARDPQKNERGLLFICANANIRRQFEFIQQTWANNEKFSGLYEDKDPILGDTPSDTGGTFTIPELPARRRLEKLARFVRVRGGEYFFLPGARSARFLATLASGAEPQSSREAAAGVSA